MRCQQEVFRSASSPVKRSPAMGRLALVCCLLLMLVLTSQQGSAAGATITGRIVYSNGAAAAGMVVQVSQVWAYTDVRGYYRLNDVPFGGQRLEVRVRDRILKATRIDVNRQHLVFDQTL